MLNKLEKPKFLQSIINNFYMGNAQFRLLAFLIPFLTYFLVYVAMLIYPFGKGTVLVLDLNGQYIYFFEALRDALVGDGSIIYSFERALSGEFLGIFAYYLASPLSLLVALFPREAMQEAILLIMLLKCGLCGLTANIYLTKTRKISEVGALIFSTCYALCGYGIVYASNTMWIDCMYLLPLIMLGIERLILKKKYLLYVVSLSMALLSSFYIGYMICIFAVIYFFAFYCSLSDEELNVEHPRAHFIKSGLRFSLFSLISGAMASPLILPMLYSLQFGKNDFSNPKFAFTVKTEFLDIFLKLLPASYDTVRPEGMPFIYCSVLCVVLTVLYFIIPSISSRKKATYGIISAILAISFCGSTIDLAWHGFQFPNWLNFRYSFIFTFIMIVMAADAFTHLKEVKPSAITAVVMVFIVLSSVMQKFEYEYLNEFACIWAAVGCGILVLIGLRAMVRNPKSGSIVLLCLTVAELLGNGIACEYMMDADVGFSNHASYANFMAKYRVLTDEINEKDPSLYRSENLDMRKVNDNYAIDLNGVSGSTSTLNKKVIDFLANMGYSSRSHHSNYSGTNPFADSLLGIKYIYANTDKNTMDPYYSLVKKDEENKTSVYENPYALPIAYTVNPEFETLDTASFKNPFELMNEMARIMPSSKGVSDMWKAASFEIMPENAEKGSGSSMRKYQKVRTSSSARLNFVVTAEHDGVMYAFFPTTNGYRKKTNIKYDGKEITNYFLTDKHSMICLGHHKKGDIIYVTATLEDDTLYLNNTDYFFTLDDRVFNETMTKLNSGAANLDTEHSDTKFTGTVEIKSGKNMLLLTMPYDKNIAVYANGEKIPTFEAAGIFTGVTLDDGVYDFKVVYEPKELYNGLLIALFGLVILLIYALADMRIKEKADLAEISAAAETETSESDIISENELAGVDEATDTEPDQSKE